MPASQRTGGSLRLRLGTFLVELVDTRLRAALAAAFAGACAGAIEYAIHQALRYSSLAYSLGAVMDAIFVGITASVLATVWLFAARERRKRVLQDMRTIAELNHNVRNALEVIVHSHYGSDDQHTEMVLESVERIERTLRELFPTATPDRERRSRVLIPDRRRSPR